MKKYVNGQYVEMTESEIVEAKKQSAIAEAQEKNRPMTVEEVSRMLITRQINTLDVDDGTALRMREFYPQWEDLTGQTVEEAGFKFQYGGKLYKTIPAKHTFAAEWVPGVGTESLYTRIDETHAGTIADPIPYEGNMALVKGLYYLQDYNIYLCTADTVNPVYQPLSELVGIYVEEASP